MRHESFVTRSKFLITRERAKPRFRAKIGDFRANPAREPTRALPRSAKIKNFGPLLGVSRQGRVRGSRRKVRRSFCARCQSRFAQSPRRVESRVIASSVVSRRLSCRCASSSCSVSVASCAESCPCQLRLGVRRSAARCQSRRVRSPAASSCPSQRPFFLFRFDG